MSIENFINKIHFDLYQYECKNLKKPDYCVINKDQFIQIKKFIIDQMDVYSSLSLLSDFKFYDVRFSFIESLKTDEILFCNYQM